MLKKRKVQLMFLSILLIVMQVACTQKKPTESVAQTKSDTIAFTDGLGRSVSIPVPSKLERVYCDSTNSFVLQYILAPDTITASPSKFTQNDVPYVPQSMVNLPSYGTKSGAHGVLDYEAMKAANVQLLISSSMGESTAQADREAADKLQEQLQIPVIVFGTQIDQLPQSFTLLGKALGHEEEATVIVDYFNTIIQRVTAVVAKTPENRHRSLYYAEGKDGLATEPGNSNRSIVFNMCGTKNVATVKALSGYGQASVSMESLLSWNPEIIITQGGTGAYKIITTSPDWASINAVKNKYVYEMPNKPFGWADRPPGANRVIGILWLSNILYPKEMNMDFEKEVIDYYKVIYHVDITQEDVQKLLTNAIPKK